MPPNLIALIQLTVEEDLESWRVLTVVGDDDARASDDLSGLALSVDLLLYMSVASHIPLCVCTHSKTGPLSEDLGVRDLDELNVVLGTEGLNELQVLG